MEKLGISGIRGSDRIRSLSGFLGGAGKATAVPNPRSSLDSVPYGSFASLKLTAEKMVREQASVKTDLELAHTKLQRSTEHIHILEAKLQEAVNENAKLKVKQTEEAKLWKGLDSKLASTRMMSDQLTETLRHLAGQARAAEEDKKFFEEKLSENSKAFDDLNFYLTDLSEKLEFARKTIEKGKQEMLELRCEKEEMEKSFREELSATNYIVKEKDSAVKQLKVTLEEDKLRFKSFESRLQEVQHELKTKEDTCKCLRAAQENLEREKSALQCSNDNFVQQIEKSQQEIKDLEDLVHSLMDKIVEVDEQSVTISNHMTRHFSSLGIFFNLVQQEKELAVKNVQGKFDQLHKQYLLITSESDVMNSENEELKHKIMELQKTQEYVVVQHAEECHVTEDKIRRLEYEAEALVSRNNELEILATDLKEEVQHLSEASTLTESQLHNMSERASRLECKNQEIQEKVNRTLQEKAEEKEALQNEIAKRDQHVNSLEDQINQLHNVLDEKKQLHIKSEEREKRLEEKISEIQALLAAAECKLIEEGKQYDLMLESKQLELSKHLKELSQKNDQAINDIRRKYEMEKEEIANTEKEKAEKLIKEIEIRCDEKISESKSEAQQYLMRVKEEHGALIIRVQQDYDQKELSLRAHQKEELQRVQLQAENEMREKTSALRKEHEMQIKALKLQYEDDYRKLEEELELQKSKEEKQRALLQLQWKVMGENQEDDHEANSKKEYSASFIKGKDHYVGKENRLALTKNESRRKDVNLSALMHTPVANLLKKVKKGNPGSAVSIPKHSKKVTRHEYEVETSNGRTITKRRKTKSTVMFGEPNTHKTPRIRTPNVSKDIVKVRKVIGEHHSHPANIGDLFSEGSLNPYTDDPYAFD